MFKGSGFMVKGEWVMVKGKPHIIIVNFGYILRKL